MHLKKLTFQLGILFMVLLTLGCQTRADGQSGSKNEERDAPQSMTVSIEGWQVVQSPESHGSGSRSSQEEPRYGVKIRQAMAENGREMTELHGAVIHYIETSKSLKLIRKFKDGDHIMVKGRIRGTSRARQLEVDSIQPVSSGGSGSNGSGSKS